MDGKHHSHIIPGYQISCLHGRSADGVALRADDCDAGILKGPKGSVAPVRTTATRAGRVGADLVAHDLESRSRCSAAELNTGRDVARDDVVRAWGRSADGGRRAAV